MIDMIAQARVGNFQVSNASLLCLFKGFIQDNRKNGKVTGENIRASKVGIKAHIVIAKTYN